ncbi:MULTISPECIES: sigma factor-like helix-turn-helix DNA-binding protein [Streptomyces]
MHSNLERTWTDSECRRVLILVGVHGLSYKTVGKRLGRSPDAVRRKYQRLTWQNRDVRDFPVQHPAPRHFLLWNFMTWISKKIAKRGNNK